MRGRPTASAFTSAWSTLTLNRPVVQLTKHRPSTPFAMAKLHSEAADRNKGPILDVLRRVLPAQGRLLEIASGSGQHVAHFATELPEWTFAPTDVDADARASINTWVREADLRNVESAVELDASSWPWPVGEVDAVMNANMIHISPWVSTLGLIRGAGRTLRDGGLLVLYGPYMVDGYTATSNVRFSESLRARNREWGVRELRDVERIALGECLELEETVKMPANNLCVIFRKKAST